MTRAILEQGRAERPKGESGTALIRKAESAGDFIAGLALIRAHIAALQIPEASAYLDVTPASLATAYNRPEAGFFLCSRANAANIGCIAYKAISVGTAQLNYFYVQPSERGRGMGRALLKTALDAARDGGFEEVVLSTLPTLRSAQALYDELGFSEARPMFDDLPGAIFYRNTLSRE